MFWSIQHPFKPLHQFGIRIDANRIDEREMQTIIRCLCFNQLQMLPNILQEALLITFIWEYVWLNEITYFNIIDKQQFIRYNYLVRNKQIVTKVVIQIDIIKLYSENLTINDFKGLHFNPTLLPWQTICKSLMKL